MEFNNIWTKEVNDQYRKMIIDKKSMDEIRAVLGEKMEHHPTKFKYGCKPIIKSYQEFLNEIVYTPLYTDFVVKHKKSEYFEGEYDYRYIFKTNSNTVYYLDFTYLQESVGPCINKDLYNISFTTEELYNKYLETDDYKDYEMITNKNEQHELIKRCVYLVEDFNNSIGRKSNSVYIIGDTDDERKIKFYIDLITCSMPLIIKLYGDSSINLDKKAWYFIPKK